jgi:hypothetical protein
MMPALEDGHFGRHKISLNEGDWVGGKEALPLDDARRLLLLWQADHIAQVKRLIIRPPKLCAGVFAQEEGSPSL